MDRLEHMYPYVAQHGELIREQEIRTRIARMGVSVGQAKCDEDNQSYLGPCMFRGLRSLATDTNNKVHDENSRVGCAVTL